MPGRPARTAPPRRTCMTSSGMYSGYACVAVRASRLVSLLLLLQARGGLTAAELARELEVSVRSIHRDVEALSAAGVPIYADRGPHGGIRLVDGYRTRLTGHDGRRGRGAVPDRPARPGGRARPRDGGRRGPAQGDGGAAHRAAGPRVAPRPALPPGRRPAGSRGRAVPHLGALAEAVWGERRISLELRARRPRGAARSLEPLGVVLKAGVWYLVASSEGQIRTYRASRVAGVSPTDERFERPEGFDLAAYWAESTAAYERDTPRIDVTVRVDPERLYRLEDAFGGRNVAAAVRLDDRDPDGWLRLRLRLDWPEEVPGRLMGCGAGRRGARAGRDARSDRPPGGGGPGRIRRGRAGSCRPCPRTAASSRRFGLAGRPERRVAGRAGSRIAITRPRAVIRSRRGPDRQGVEEAAGGAATCSTWRCSIGGEGTAELKVDHRDYLAWRTMGVPSSLPARLPAIPAGTCQLSGGICQISRPLARSRAFHGRVNSAIVGGSAPARSQVTAATSTAASTAACKRVEVSELAPSQPAGDPPGEERATERVAGAHGVDDLHVAGGDAPLTVPGVDDRGTRAVGQKHGRRTVALGDASSVRAASSVGMPGRR